MHFYGVLTGTAEATEGAGGCEFREIRPLLNVHDHPNVGCKLSAAFGASNRDGLAK
jgi:hypothetical protein